MYCDSDIYEAPGYGSWLRKDGLTDIGSSVCGPGMIQLKGSRTLKSPGVPASAAFVTFVAQWAVSDFALSSGNTETKGSRFMYRIPGTAVEVQLRVWVQVGVSGTDGVE